MFARVIKYLAGVLQIDQFGHSIFGTDLHKNVDIIYGDPALICPR